ncbi:hypothetical protein QF028_004903 [Neobacillus sp. B4I6]|uniref:hypothetical protein n=1 Tax=Neobacillus sp. B4I6 TaxID=3373925 RepID=UPI003D1D3AB1
MHVLGESLSLELFTDIKTSCNLRNEDDGKQLQTLVNKTIEQKITIDEVLADTAYSGKGNLSFLQT